MQLNGKYALVTGSARGIGKGCALALAEAGAHVILNDRPDSPDLNKTLGEIQKVSSKGTAVESDIFTPDGRQELIGKTLKQVDRIDILISNPAYSIRHPFLEFPLSDFEKVIQGALISGFHMSQLVARHMVSRGNGGKIVFISSVHALMPYAKSVAYNAAKAGLDHMAQTIALELTEHRINVNAIEPGWIDTPGERGYFSDSTMQAAGSTLPWGRLGKPLDIGKAAAFLSSEEADYITGAILRVDGGFWFKDAIEDER